MTNRTHCIRGTPDAQLCIISPSLRLTLEVFSSKELLEQMLLGGFKIPHRNPDGRRVDSISRAAFNVKQLNMHGMECLRIVARSCKSLYRTPNNCFVDLCAFLSTGATLAYASMHAEMCVVGSVCDRLQEEINERKLLEFPDGDDGASGAIEMHDGHMHDDEPALETDTQSDGEDGSISDTSSSDTSNYDSHIPDGDVGFPSASAYQVSHAVLQTRHTATRETMKNILDGMQIYASMGNYPGKAMHHLWVTIKTEQTQWRHEFIVQERLSGCDIPWNLRVMIRNMQVLRLSECITDVMVFRLAYADDVYTAQAFIRLNNELLKVVRLLQELEKSMVAPPRDYSFGGRQNGKETCSVLDSNQAEQLYAPTILRVVAVIMAKYADDDVVQEEGSRYRKCMATVLENASLSPP